MALVKWRPWGDSIKKLFRRNKPCHVRVHLTYIDFYKVPGTSRHLSWGWTQCFQLRRTNYQITPPESCLLPVSYGGDLLVQITIIEADKVLHAAARQSFASHRLQSRQESFSLAQLKTGRLRQPWTARTELCFYAQDMFLCLDIQESSLVSEVLPCNFDTRECIPCYRY